MKIKIELDIRPFDIPTYVNVIKPAGNRQAGISPAQKIDLNELDAVTVEALCDDFKKKVMQAHKKFMEPFDAAIAKCEQNLPRNQTCVLVYEAKVKQ